MKTKLLSILSGLLLFTAIATAQTSTKGFSFQGYAIDPDGKSLGSTNITVKFTLSSISNAATPFIEIHPLITDAFGVFNAIIGDFDAASTTAFAKLDFTKAGDENYTLKVEVKKTSGGTYTIISNAPMNAVPYARKAENGVPVGTIVAFGGPKTSIPAGWLACDGTLLIRTAYPQLFAVIGTGWGTTSATNFAAPDARGFFFRGVDEGRGIDLDAAARYASGPTGGNTGDNVGSGQWNINGTHNHTTSYNGSHSHNLKTEYGASVNPAYVAPNGQYNMVSSSNSYINTVSVQAAGGHTHTVHNSGGSETRPSNLYVYYIIKY